MAEKGKLGKNARVTTQFNKNVVTEIQQAEGARAQIFTEIKNALKEAKIGHQNLSPSHPFIINKGKFAEALEIIKPMVNGGDNDRFEIEKEEPGTLIFVEKNVTKDPLKIHLKEGAFSWY
jgi:hypothetical protein